MRQKQIPGEEVLGKVVEFHMLSTKTICCSDTADAGEFVHVLQSQSLMPERSGVGVLVMEKRTTRVQLPANRVLFLPLMNTIPGTTLT